VRKRERERERVHTHTHTQTCIHIHTYAYAYSTEMIRFQEILAANKMCVRVCLCVCVCMCVQVLRQEGIVARNRERAQRHACNCNVLRASKDIDHVITLRLNEAYPALNSSTPLH